MRSAADVAGWLRTAFSDDAIAADALATYVDATLRFGIDAPTMDDLTSDGATMGLADAGVDNAIHRSKIARAWRAERGAARKNSGGDDGSGGGGGSSSSSGGGRAERPRIDYSLPAASRRGCWPLANLSGGVAGSQPTQPLLHDERLMPQYWKGFSMEDAMQHATTAAAAARERTPTQVLEQLQRGNARFWMGMSQRPEANAFQRRALIMQQWPSVCIIGCSDSRVPIEIIFDQGLGDVFVVRVAGNCLGTSVTASLEYAVHHLNVKCLVVMGHEGCGAVRASGLPVSALEKEPPALRDALLAMKEGIDEERLASIHDPRARDREAVVTNVVSQLERLSKQHPFIMEKVSKQELLVTGAFYEISSGIVDFFGQIEC